MEDLYKRILQMGLDRGYKNMTDICVKSGVKRATMTEFKNGRTLKLSLDTLSKFAALYQTTVDDILCGNDDDEKETPTATMDDGLKDCLDILRERPDTRALVHAGRDMTPEQVGKIADFMRSMRGY